MEPKIFNNELRDAFLAALETHKDAIAQIKASNDAGAFEVVISTEDQDRQGEIVKQDGWNLENFQKNPIVLWAHDYSSLPIGVCDEIKIENGQLVAKGRFAPEEANPFAQQVRRLYDLKIVRATSVGFIANDMEGNVVTKAELLEFSFVPVPANPMALSLNQIASLGLDIPMLALKGIEIKPKADDPDEEEDAELEEKIKEILQDAEDRILEAIEEDDEEEEGEGAENEGGEGESGEGKSKAGRRISGATREKLEEAMGHLEDGLKCHAEAMQFHKKAIRSHKAAHAALRELLASAEKPQPDEGEETPDGESPNERSNSAPSLKRQEALDTFLLGREIVRQIETVAREGLGRLNARGRTGRR